MNRAFFLLVFGLIVHASTQTLPLFGTDIRVRVVNDTLLYVVVQVENHSGRTVTELEGFLTELDSRSDIISEEKMVHVHDYDPSLQDGFSVVRGVTFPFDPSQSRRYRFHFSHIKFRNDPRVFVYDPASGLIRIE